MTTAPSRRERQRQATYDEIVEVARGLLRASQDVSVRAVAQEMGLTAPALYRYVDSYAELMRLVARSIFADVVAAMAAARDAQAPDDPSARIVVSAAAFRRWALNNPEEFQLVFASPSARLGATPQAGSGLRSLHDCAPEDTGADLFAAYFSEMFGALWEKYHFAVPADSDLDPQLVRALAEELKPDTVTDRLGGPTAGMIWMFERAWARLYGTVTLEVFGHVHPAFISTGALFDATMLDIGQELGIQNEWPRLRRLAEAQY